MPRRADIMSMETHPANSTRFREILKKLPFTKRAVARIREARNAKLEERQARAEKSRLEEIRRQLEAQIKRSETVSQTVEQWWDECRTDSQYAFWLTGSQGSNVWSSLEIEDRIAPGRQVLNIGVGEGYCTRELAERGCHVHALDISRIALEKIRDCVDATWSPSDLSRLPSDTFDLAISHLVAQHMCDADLSEQFHEVVRSLKSDGIFALQFAFRLDGDEDQIEQTSLNMKTGSICRSLEKVSRLVADANGQIVWQKKIGLFPEQGSGWYGIHIAKQAS